jgi:hypothetical protein
MNYLRDNPDASAALCRCLLTNYKNLGSDGAQEILRLLGNQDSQAVADALDRHLLSAAARFPPKPGDITEHIRDIEAQRRKAGPQAAAPRRRTVTVPMTPELKGYFPGLDEIELLTSVCRDCGDTGMARFYINWDDAEHPHRVQRVYTAAEAFKLPASMFGHLRVTAAVCDCLVGRAMPCRQARTIVRNVDVSVWPTIGQVQAASRKQRRLEREAVGVVE